MAAYRIFSETGKNKVKLCVEDNGIGIRPEEHGARVRKRILRDKWTERQIFYRDRTLPYEETLRPARNGNPYRIGIRSVYTGMAAVSGK